jgi:hypothetical protein
LFFYTFDVIDELIGLNYEMFKILKKQHLIYSADFSHKCAIINVVFYLIIMFIRIDMLLIN